MRNLSGIDNLLEAGYYPSLSMQCYSVSYTAGTRRTFTRYSAGDISSQYIDMDSIHAEWCYSSNDTFEGGGCIPISLSFRLLPGSGLTLETVPYPQSPADYSYAYRPYITFRKANGGGTTSYTIFPYMILREQSRSRGDNNAKKLYFEDETCMFDYAEIDVASKYGKMYAEIVQHIMRTVGLGDENNSGYSGVSLTGISYYQGEPMSARQCLSYIGQANGVFFQMNSNSMLKIKEMLAAQEDSQHPGQYAYDFETNWQYELGHSMDEVLPTIKPWVGVLVFPYDQNRRTGNYPRMYCLYDNPFVISSNYTTYQTLLRQRLVKNLHYSGMEITYRFDPRIELGDYICYRFLHRDGDTIGGNPLTVCRITWDGSAFFTLKGPSFARYNRI